MIVSSCHATKLPPANMLCPLSVPSGVLYCCFLASWERRWLSKEGDFAVKIKVSNYLPCAGLCVKCYLKEGQNLSAVLLIGRTVEIGVLHFVLFIL